MTKRQYSWKRQPVDHRDFKFSHLASAKKFSLTTPPLVANNRRWCSAVKDQGQQGSCTGHAWTGICEYNENKFGFWTKYHDLSRAFVYFNERLGNNQTDQDSGAMLRDGAKALATYGVCFEGDFPYHDTDYTTKPSDAVYKVALRNVIHSYYSISTLDEMKLTIANGQCFVFGFDVYEYFESQEMANTGILQMPQQGEQYLGGHAVMAVGYNDHEKRFLIRNSWGRNWGLKGHNAGYFTMPYDYMMSLASDFWTVVHDV